jgi:glycosyltransferase involved in cell wall biosynthesis
MTNQALRASVLIPTYQRCASVRRLLGALAQQTLPGSSYEVIVAIDGSDDRTAEMVASFAAPYGLRSFWQPNRGRAAACNLGLRECRGEVVVILDDDMEPVPGFLAAHLERHRESESYGVLGAVPIPIEPITPPVVRFVAAKFSTHLNRLAQPEKTIGIRDFYSGNFSIRRDMLVKIGGFDEEFRIYGNEDGELAARLQTAGVRLIFSAEAEARQYYEKDFAALARDNLAKGRTAVLCACKHPDKISKLKIGTRNRGSRKWRAFRKLLVMASAHADRIPHEVVRFISFLEQRQAAALFAWYGRALDYFFWLGVDSELREQSPSGEERAHRIRALLRAVP